MRGASAPRIGSGSFPYDVRVGRIEAAGNCRPREMAVLDRTRLTDSLRVVFSHQFSVVSSAISVGHAALRAALTEN